MSLDRKSKFVRLTAREDIVTGGGMFEPLEFDTHKLSVVAQIKGDEVQKVLRPGPAMIRRVISLGKMEVVDYGSLQVDAPRPVNGPVSQLQSDLKTGRLRPQPIHNRDFG